MGVVAIFLAFAVYFVQVAWIGWGLALCALTLAASAIGLMREMEWARLSGGLVSTTLGLAAILVPLLVEGVGGPKLLYAVILCGSGGYLLLPSTKRALHELRAHRQRQGESA